MTGGSLSHTRCSTPRRYSTAYQPSGACRSAPAVNSLSLRLTRVSAPDGGAGRTGITVGKTSGAQNTICSEKDWPGLAAKTKPPFLAKLGAHNRGLRNAAMVPLIVWIAAQTLPSQSGHLRISSAVVAVRRPPIKPRHSRPHFYSKVVSRHFPISRGCGNADYASSDASNGYFDDGRSSFQRAMKT